MCKHHSLSISKDHIREFSYDVIGASFKYKVNKHPQSDLMGNFRNI